MLPREWRRVFEQLIRHRPTLVTQVLHGIGQVGRVQKDNDRDHQVQPRRPELLRVLAAVGNAALLEGADHLGQGVALLALAQPGLAALAQGGRLKPVDREQGALDAPQPLQCQVELVLALKGGQAFQHGRGQHDAGLQGGDQAQNLAPVLPDDLDLDSASDQRRRALVGRGRLQGRELAVGQVAQPRAASAVASIIEGTSAMVGARRPRLAASWRA